MQLSSAELQEAAALIAGQDKSAKWLASYSKSDSVWIVELPSSGLETVVRYLKRHRQCVNFNKEALVFQSSTNNPIDRERGVKYGLFSPRGVFKPRIDREPHA